MAVVRTVLPRKGIIEPQHGSNYEADLDANWTIIDSLLQDSDDVQAAVMAAGTVAAWLKDTGVCGVASGFTLSPSANLVPGLSPGVLYGQGSRWAPTEFTFGAAPANATSFVWWNSSSGFYYNLTGVPAAAGDAYLGTVTTDASHVTSVTPATKIYGRIPASAPAAGNLTLPHQLGRAPLGALIYMTSGGQFWFQAPTMFDGANLYLVASDAGITSSIQVW